MRNLVDRVVCLAGLVALAPVLVVIAGLVRWGDGGPVLFRQVRVGRCGRSFVLLKFRSMRVDPGGPAITAAGDGRVTRLGRWLRAYKLDELPQLWNVVRGDMSLVGPRPEVRRYVDPGDPVWQRVLSVRPGITDLATLVYRNEEQLLAGSAEPERFYREEILPEKLRLNLRYFELSCWGRDWRLLAMTVGYSLRPAGFTPETVLRRLAA
ncbi:MAG: sugar transferase [Acidobacteriota bacterium]|jgi:lipopolysaccharide/colanic/teichoic acid biosynthesis glycosyltransferase|nr:sugar transferase [Acidobacteriaceae bacterium]